MSQDIRDERDVIGTNLDVAIERAVRDGWYSIFVHPRVTNPAERDFYARASLDPDVIRERHDAARELVCKVEADRANDFAHWRNKRTGKLHAAAEAARLYTDYSALDLNLGVHLGPSRLLVVDVDTSAEFETWYKVCEKFGYDPGDPTVCSPGKTKNGVWIHRSGGHYYYTSDDPRIIDWITAGGGINLRITEEGFLPENKETREQGDFPAIQSGDRFVVCPPSIRVPGPYLNPSGSLDPRQLPPFLVDMIHQYLDAQQRKRRTSVLLDAKGEIRSADPRLIEWERSLDVLSLFDGYECTGEDQHGCAILTRPGGSDRSAVVHVPHCEDLMFDTDHIMVTFFTTNRPEWVLGRVEQDTFALSTLYAMKHYDGSTSRMKRDLGLFGDSRRIKRVITEDEDTAPARTKVTVVTHKESDTTVTITQQGDRTVYVLDIPEESEVTVERHDTEQQESEAVTTESDPDLWDIDTEDEPQTATVDTEDEPQTATVDTDPVQEIDDSYVPTTFEGEVPRWDIVHPLDRLVALLERSAVTVTDTTLNYLTRVEEEVGQPTPDRFDSDEDRKWYFIDRKTRINKVHSNYRTVSNKDIADALGVEPFRVQAWIRSLIPFMDAKGIIVCEREDSRSAKQIVATWEQEQRDALESKGKDPDKAPNMSTRTRNFPTASVNTHWMLFRKETIS